MPEGAPGRGHTLLGCNMLSRVMFRKGGWWTAVDGRTAATQGGSSKKKGQSFGAVVLFWGLERVPTFCTSSAHPMCSEQGYSVCQNHHTNTNSLAFLKAACVWCLDVFDGGCWWFEKNEKRVQPKTREKQTPRGCVQCSGANSSQTSPEHGPCSDQGVQETLAWAVPSRASLAVPTGANANTTAESTMHTPKR